MITLKKPEFKDYVDIYHKRFQPEVVYWADDEDPQLTMEEYAESRMESQDDGSVFERIIMLDDTPIGTITARDLIRKTGQCTLGIVIADPQYWGHGYGTIALREFLGLLTRQGIQIVVLDTYASKMRAQRRFRRLGVENHRVYFASVPGRFVVQMINRVNRWQKHIAHTTPMR